MESEIYARVKDMSLNSKGTRQVLADELLKDTDDEASLVKKIEEKREEIIKALDSEIIPSSIGIDLRLNLTILDTMLKGE